MIPYISHFVSFFDATLTQFGITLFQYGPAPSAPSATPVDLVAEAESDHRDHEDEREAAGERKMRDEDVGGGGGGGGGYLTSNAIQ